MSKFLAALQNANESESEPEEEVPAPIIEEPQQEQAKPEPLVEEEKDAEEPSSPIDDKKKKKKKKKKKGDKDDEKAPKKPITKAAQLAKQRLEQKKLEEEKRALEEAERIKKEEEERVLREEEARIQLIKDQEKEEEMKIIRAQKRKEREAREELEKQKKREQFLLIQQAEEKRRAEAQKAMESKQINEDESASGESYDEGDEEDYDGEEEDGKDDDNAPLAEVDDWENLVDDDEEEDVEKELQKKKKMMEDAENKRKEAKRKRLTKGKNKKKKKAKEDQEEDIVEEIKEEITEVNPNEIEYLDPKKAFYVDSPYRCPIVCILGHVDTGKTLLLDKIRSTKVQEGEEGGITQQIGASFFPQYKLKEEVDKLKSCYKEIPVQIPGLLIIDTPGHESFANLRQRGESLCDFAILVVDIKHGLENQTLESLNMLKERETPFVIALNKIDTTAEWRSSEDASSLASLNSQSGYTKNLFEERLRPILTQLGQNDINGCLYWDKDKGDNFIKMVPTSAKSGEGIPDLLGYIANYCQTYLPKQIAVNEVDFVCTIMEVKKIDGIGTTIDVILVDGILKEGDKICLTGFDGVIATTVRALLTPHPMKELRVRAEYIHHKELKGAMGFKISAPGLEKAVAGSQLYKYDTDEQLEEYTESLSADIKKIKKKFKLKPEGVGVAASTLGSLEALLVFLRSKKIPVSFVCIGDVKKMDIMAAMTALFSEENKIKKKEFATILAFDVKLNPEAEVYAKMNKVNVIIKKTIYRLCDDYIVYVKKCEDERKAMFRKVAVFPVILKPVAFFHNKDPIVMGAEVLRGVLKIGTPLIVPSKGKLKVGVVISMEENHKPLEEARSGNGQIAIKLKSDSNITAGRQFDLTDNLFSNLTRKSVDILKDYFRDEVRKTDWDLVRDLKAVLDF